MFFDGDTFNGVRRLPIPFHPAVFVNGVVQAAQLERQQTDPLSFSDPEAMRLPEMRSTSIGVMVIPGLYYLFGKLADGRKLLRDESDEPLSEMFQRDPPPEVPEWMD